MRRVVEACVCGVWLRWVGGSVWFGGWLGLVIEAGALVWTGGRAGCLGRTAASRVVMACA